MSNHRTKKPTNGATPDTLGKERPSGKWKPLFDEKTDAEKKHLNTMLISAVLSRKLEMVENFLDQGADVDAKDEKGRSALKWAKFTGAKAIVEFLESKGAKE